ncbi:DUF4405 domain-containing protein [uncultured Dialister sp.]|uniref:DUF4405 domain-containing protein n=1 Tax=uncultured Dialister sp. TaxID=278064 RepID=UPI0025E1223A|nr:DUF4405 domain-containing protein [uncultured Dialister sp.]
MNKRMIVDTGMLISFLVLLDYRFVRNFGHETLAIVFFLLFLLHTWFNRQWYASLGRGLWNMDRKLTFLADVLLLGSFAAVMGSGLMISHTLPTGMQKAPLLAHQVHHVAGYVMLIALGFHLGLHWSAILSRLEGGLGFGKIPHLSLVYKVLLLLIAAGGIYFSLYYSIGSRLLLLPSPMQGAFLSPSGPLPSATFLSFPSMQQLPTMCRNSSGRENGNRCGHRHEKNRSGKPFLFFYAYFSSPFQ